MEKKYKRVVGVKRLSLSEKGAKAQLIKAFGFFSCERIR